MLVYSMGKRRLKLQSWPQKFTSFVFTERAYFISFFDLKMLKNINYTNNKYLNKATQTWMTVI